MINEKTKENLRRKSAYVDDVQMRDGVPLFSWIDINLTELCNRLCEFCPRVNPEFYPNQNLNASLGLMEKIAAELKSLDYKGCIVFCGFGEPMLHPKFTEVVKIFANAARLELVTNGDKLNAKNIAALLEAGIDYFVVSMYDGPHQIEYFEKLFAEAGAPSDMFILRDRWHNEEDNFGLKLTNRAGTVHVGRQDPIDVTHPCHYPAYSMTVDWNGDVLLCVQDWNKKVKLGNLHQQTMMEVWTSPALHKYRARLAAGRRSAAPCNRCNTDGTLHGFNHVKRWPGLDKA